MTFAENVYVIGMVWDIAIAIAVIVILYFAYRWWRKRPAKVAKKQ